MAATAVDICNLALSRLGDRATVVSLNPPEGSVQADHCARFYPQARDTALSANDWGFASVREQLTQLDVGFQGWLHTYVVPNNCLVVRDVFSVRELEVLTDHRQVEYRREALADGTQVILANEPELWLRYTRRMEDPNRFSVPFTQALVTLLAAYLAGPVVRGKIGAQMGTTLMADFTAQVARAEVIDANQRNAPPRSVPSGVRVRGASPAAYIRSSTYGY